MTKVFAIIVVRSHWGLSRLTADTRVTVIPNHRANRNEIDAFSGIKTCNGRCTCFIDINGCTPVLSGNMHFCGRVFGTEYWFTENDFTRGTHDFISVTTRTKFVYQITVIKPWNRTVMRFNFLWVLFCCVLINFDLFISPDLLFCECYEALFSLSLPWFSISS